MNYWTEFKCLSCARTCCETPGNEGAAWASLARGMVRSGTACAMLVDKVPKCARCGGRLYAAETHQYYGENPPWQEAAESGESRQAIPKSA